MIASKEIEELAASLSHLKEKLQREVPANITNLRTQIKQTLEEIKTLEKGSSEARAAYDTLEELDAALSHSMKRAAPKVAENIDFIKSEIKKYEDLHLDVHQEDHKFDEEAYEAAVVRLYECQEEMKAISCNYDPETLERIEDTRELLKEALEIANKTKKGSKERSLAWDTVEELEASISHMKATMM